jgi:hypothetical protein
MTEEQKISQTKIDIDSISAQLVNVSEVHLNVSQELVITTEDKIKLCLSNYLKRMENRRAWIAPLGIFLTIIIALSTTTFQNYLLDAATWRAIFIISGIVSFVWFIRTVNESSQAATIEDIISELKKGSQIKSGKKTFEISKAIYWTSKAELDVTTELRNMVVDNKLETIASNDIKNDPDKGAAKKLTIEYTFNGANLKKEFKEGDKVVLP